MSDWMRSLDPLSLLIFSATCLAWGAGGWLAVRAWFAVRPGERLLAGLAGGFVVYLTLVNLFTPLVGLPFASALSAGVILAAGLGAAWRSRLGWAALCEDLRDWPQLATLLALTLLFELAQRGVSLFDEYLHLPLVSIMGTGIIPPRFYLNPDLQFAYHYGLQVFAAVLENLARFFPWSAWDLTRGLSIALTFVLGWLWVRRGTGRAVAGALGALAIAVGGGTRWLLLLLPGSILNWVSSGVQLSNSGADTAATLTQALNRPWAIQGGGTVPFPFAYHDGVFSPQTFALGATSALPAVTVLLLLLLARPAPTLRRAGVWVTLTFIFANLALSAEHLFAFLWISLAIVMAVHAWRAHRQRRPLARQELLGWGAVLAVSAALSAFQGGFISVTISNLLASLRGVQAASNNVYGFSLRWPPAIISAHLGLLSPFNPRQLVALLAEMGPALLAAPLASWFSWRALRRGNWLVAALGLAALLMVLFTLFIQYGVDRSSTRFADSSLWLWLTLAFPLLWWAYQRGKNLLRAWLGGLYGITLVGGLVIFAIQLTSVTQPIPAYFINSLDLRMSQKYWNQLEPSAEVLDSSPMRSVTVFGRISKAYASIYVPLPEWQALVKDPTPQKALAAGFSYVYMDQNWWNNLTPQLRADYQQSCVRLVDELQSSDGASFRRLYDIQACP